MGARKLEAVAAAMEEAAIQADGVALRPLIAAARRRFEVALAELKTLQDLKGTFPFKGERPL
jgi:hypothetical protein